MGSSFRVTNSTQSWSVGETEVGYNLEKTAKDVGLTEAAEWKLYIPKIMPLITKGIPVDKVEALSSTIFVNDKACKPVVQPTIKVRNYITVKRPANRSFAYKYKKHDMEVEVDVLHANIDNLRVSNNVDNSTPKAK